MARTGTGQTRLARWLTQAAPVGEIAGRQRAIAEPSSRFFAESKRLHAILAMATHLPPVLFLLDELLNGTNSQDRREGAEAVLRQLLERGAVGW